MEVEVKQLENHIAQLVVQVDNDVFDKSMRKAARKLSRELNIPGFRAGKAPFEVVLNLVGPQELVREVIEDIGDDVYRQALDETEIEPYSPADISDVNIDEGLKLTFEVPRQPTTELGDYRSTLRVDYDAPEEVTDEEIEKTVDELHEMVALTETVDRPVQLNDRLSIDVRGVFESTGEDEEDEQPETTEASTETDESSAEDSSAETSPAEEAEESEQDEDGEEVFVEQEDLDYVVNAEPEEDLVPGFAEQLVGMSAYEEKQFTLTLPDDYEDEEIAGRIIYFSVYVNEINVPIMPARGDIIATLATGGELNTLEELRERLRENLRISREREVNDEYFSKVLDELVEDAEFAYPEAMVEDYIDGIIQEMQDALQQQGLRIDLEQYLMLTGQSMEALREESRERAIERLQKSLAVSEFAKQEKLDVSDTEIDAEVDKRVESLNEEIRDVARDIFSRPESRSEVASNLIMEQVVSRMIDIARGLNPPIEEEPAADESGAEEAAEPSPAAEDSEKTATSSASSEVEDSAPVGETEVTTDPDESTAT